MNQSSGQVRTEQLSSTELADALWLAAHIGRPDASPATAPPSGERPAPPAAAEPPPPDEAEHGDDQRHLGTPAGQADADEFIGVPYRRSGKGAGTGRGGALSDWPQAPGMSQEQAIARALRPLKRTVPSFRDPLLDEEATAERAAEEGLWLPAYRPAPEHPFDVVLVVDDSVSMRIWRRTVREFRTLLERLGAFRDVRLMRFATDSGGHTNRPVLRGEEAGAPGRRPEQIVDPTGRRIILMITDGISDGWRDGTAGRLLAEWTRTSPVAVVDVLPYDMWHWSGIKVARARLAAASPGLPNSKLAFRPIDHRWTGGDATPVPVISLGARWFARWSELLSGTGPEGIEMPVLPATEFVEDEDRIEHAADDDPSPAQRVLRFRTTATPEAFHLAGLLAAAPLTVQMMRAVQGRLVPDSTPAHLAEVLLSGLLRRVSPPTDSDEVAVEYEFAGDLRTAFLATATRADTARVLRLVGDVLGPQVSALRDLRAALDDPDGTPEPEVTASNRHFVEVQRMALRALSGRYARRAQRLADSLESSAGTTSTTPSPPSRHDRRVARRSLAAKAAGAGPGQDRPADEGQSTRWGGVPLRNVNFIGRAELLDTLHARLTWSGTAVVLPEARHGLGGIGKSQIAVEYVYRHATDYDLIWWIPAENPSEIQNALVKLAARLGLPVEQSVDAAVPAVLEALRTGTPYARWLLVFDNADDPEEVRRFFPAGPGHVLVTSRNPRWSATAEVVEVDVFKRAESRELLQRRNGSLTDDDADRLAEALGDLPLAVEQAAAWSVETGMSAEEYLRLWEDKRSELLRSDPPADYAVAVEAAWNVSLDRLAHDNPGAVELLRVLAFFAAEPIPRNLFAGVRNLPLGRELEQTLRDEIRLSRAIREINRYSLAKLDHRTSTIQLHRLVQTVLRNRLSPEAAEQARHSAHLLLANSEPNQPESSEFWDRYGELLPHGRACVAMDCTDNWVRRLAINLAVAQFSWGDPDGARRAAEEMVEYWSEKLGPDHPDTLVISRWRGRSLRAVGRFAEAREVNQSTLDSMRRVLGEQHEETLLSMHAVASDLRAKGDFYAAMELNKVAYQHARAQFRDDDPDTLAAANNYALSLRLSGDPRAAGKLDEDTWRRKRSVLGDDHRHTLLTLDNWAVDLRESGDYFGARRLQERAVRQVRETLGAHHPMTLGAEKNLAIAYRKAGLVEWAESYAQSAWESLRDRYGEEHPEAMAAAMTLSIALRARNPGAAKDLGEQAWNRYRHVWGPDHPFSLAGATNLSVTQRVLGEVDRARELGGMAAERMRAVLGDAHPFTLACALNSASALAETGQHESACETDARTHRLSAQVLGRDHPDTLAAAHNLALDLELLARTGEAGELRNTTIERLRRLLGTQHPATQRALLRVRLNADIDPMQI